MSTGDPIARPDALGVAALGAIAFALCDSLHEFGHLLAAVLPEQGSVISISSVGVSTTTSRAPLLLSLDRRSACCSPQPSPPPTVSFYERRRHPWLQVPVGVEHIP